MPILKSDKIIEKYLFLFKDDFFELPYLSNSPQAMLSSIVNMPVFKHKRVEKAVYTNNPFCKGCLKYRQLEEGFWILESTLTVKQNILAKAIYDENELSDYYFLSFSVFEYEFPLKNYDSKEITLLSTCWTFYKPKTEVATYFYKGTKGKFYNIVFSKKWANRYMSHLQMDKKLLLESFLDSKIAFYTWLDIAPKAHNLAVNMGEILDNEEENFNLLKLKSHVLDLMSEFLKYSFQDSRLKYNIALSNLDYYKIAKAEKIILHNLSNSFVGVENIALEVNMSPTKLKSNFKTVFGFSMLQYHKEKNMLLALQLIRNSRLEIQIIALAVGYESASKFTAAFKKRFGKLPSEYRI